MKYLYLIVAFSLIVFLPIKTQIELSKKKVDEYLKIEIQFLKIIKISLEIPKMIFRIENLIPVLSFEYTIYSTKSKISKPDKIIISPLRKRYKILIEIVRELYKRIYLVKKVLKFFGKFIDFLDLNIHVTFGFENPALTGILAGHVWGSIYNLVNIISYYFNFKEATIKVNVTPIFVKSESLEIDFRGIFKLRVGHIIIASLLVLWYWSLSKGKLVSKKGSDFLWMSIPYKV